MAVAGPGPRQTGQSGRLLLLKPVGLAAGFGYVWVSGGVGWCWLVSNGELVCVGKNESSSLPVVLGRAPGVVLHVVHEFCIGADDLAAVTTLMVRWCDD